jgi:hypothetical protein
MLGFSSVPWMVARVGKRSVFESSDPQAATAAAARVAEAMGRRMGKTPSGSVAVRAAFVPAPLDMTREEADL